MCIGWLFFHEPFLWLISKINAYKNGANIWYNYFLYGYGYLHLIALFYSSFVDITGDPEQSRLEVFAKTSDSLAGNPFSVLSAAQTDCFDSDTASETDESEFAISALDDHQFADLEQRYAHMWLYSTLYVYHIITCLSPVSARQGMGVESNFFGDIPEILKLMNLYILYM